MSALALSNASLRCLGRRLTGALRAAPLLTALGLALVGAAPVGLARAGAAVGTAVGPALVDPGAARGVVVALGLPALVAGALMALAAPGLPGLGPQLAAAPVGVCGRALTMLVPVLVAGLVAAPAAGAFAVPFARAAPGGAAAGIALACSCLAAVAAGLVAGECVLGALRGSRPAVVSLAAGLTGWAAAGAVLGDLPAGPLALVPGALGGRSSPAAAAAAVSLGAAASLAAWGTLSAVRPPARPGTRRGGVVPVAGPAPAAVAVAVAKLLQRRVETRLALVAGAALGVGGIASAPVLRVPAPAAVHLAAGGAALAASLLPLAVAGVLLAGRAAWVTAPASAVTVGVPACLVALLAQAGTVLAVAFGAVVVVEAPWVEAPKAVVLALSVGACALTAGALVPWRGERLGDQLASLGSFAAVVACLPVAGTVVLAWLDAHGAPVGLVAPVLLAVLLAAGTTAVTLRIGRPR